MCHLFADTVLCEEMLSTGAGQSVENVLSGNNLHAKEDYQGGEYETSFLQEVRTAVAALTAHPSECKKNLIFSSFSFDSSPSFVPGGGIFGYGDVSRDGFSTIASLADVAHATYRAPGRCVSTPAQNSKGDSCALVKYETSPIQRHPKDDFNNFNNHTESQEKMILLKESICILSSTRSSDGPGVSLTLEAIHQMFPEFVGVAHVNLRPIG